MIKTIELNIGILLLWLLVCTDYSFGIEAIGFSALLQQNIEFDRPTENSTNVVNLITGWSVNQELLSNGFYNHNIGAKNDNITIIAPLEGIYFLSANIVIDSSTGTKVEAYFREAVSPHNQYCAIIEEVTKGLTTLSLSCFTRLKLLTELQLAVGVQDAITVRLGSSVSVQFIGASGIIPSLVLPLVNEDSLHPQFKRNFRMRKFGYFNTLTVIHENNRIAVPCAGTYIISLSVSSFGKIFSGSTLEVTINGKVVFSLPTFKDSMLWKKHVLRSFFLQRNDEIRISYDKMELDDRSSFAIIRAWDQNSGGINVPLNGVKLNTEDRMMFSFSASERSQFNTTKFNFTNNGFITATSYSLCLISLDLEVDNFNEKEKQVYDVIVRVSQRNYEYLDTTINNGLNSQFNGAVVTKEKSVSIFGVVELRARHYLSVTVQSLKRKKLKGNLVISPIQLNTLAANMSLVQPSLSELVCTSNVVSYTHLSMEGFLLNKYILQNDTIFQAPDNALYLFHIRGAMQLVRNGNVNFTAYIRHKHINGTVSDIKEYVFLRKKKILKDMFFVRLIAMEKGDQVQVLTSCNKNVKFLDTLNVEIILMDHLPTSNYITVKIPVGTETLKPKHKMNYTVHKPGVYFLIYNVILAITNLVRDLKIEIRVNRGGINLLYEEKFVSSSGLVTLHTFGFLKFEENEIIQTEIICTGVNSETAEISEFVTADDFIVRVEEETMEYIKTTNENRVTHGFRGVQLSSNFFDFGAKFTSPHAFRLTNEVGGFRLERTQLFGVQFIVPKPMTVFYIASVQLKDVSGSFQLMIRIRSRRGMVNITPRVVVDSKATITLRASGLLSLGVGDSVEFVVNGDTENKDVLCTKSLWSLMEITTPYPEIYGINKKKQTDQERRTSIFLTRNADGIPANGTTFTRDGKTPQEFYTVQKAGPVIDILSQLQNKNKNTTGTDAKILVLSNVTHALAKNKCQVILLEGNSEEFKLLPRSQQVVTDLHVGQQNIQLFCLKNDEQVLFTQGLRNMTSSYVKMDSSIEAFSTILDKSQNIDLINNKPERINGWKTRNIPFFDRSQGYREGSGMYVVPANGFYLLTLRLSVIVDSAKSCMLFLQIEDKMEVAIHLSRVTVYNDVMWLQKDSVLQVMVNCHSNTTLTLDNSSTFSIVQTDSRVSLPMECLQSEIQLSVDKEIAYTQVSTPYQVTCYHNQQLIGDFTWKKNGEVIMTSLGVRKLILDFALLKMEDHGKYECIMERGKDEVYSKKVEMIVIDPRPKIKLSNSNISIEENTFINPMIAWAHVEAYNLSTNKIAPVRLSIVEGDPDDFFHFEPDHATFVTTLKFRKPFDYELQQSFTLTIEAKNTEFDGQLGVVTKQIQVNVVNRNEHKPHFKIVNKSVSIDENTKIGTVISRFLATDSDLVDRRETLVYSLVNTPNSHLFRMGLDTGELLVADSIDYEVVQEINLVIAVSDIMYSTYTEFKVDIKNVNDNQPRFVQDKYALNISSLQELYFPILALKAMDKDYMSDENEERIKYRIVSGNDQGHFKMSSGNLVPVQLLKVGQMFDLSITAYDEDEKPSETNATVFIRVIPPVQQKSKSIRVFEDLFCVETLDENKPRDSFVFQPAIKHEVSHLPLVYKLKEFGETKHFRITQNGTVLVLNPVDYEKRKMFYLVITACVRSEPDPDSCHLLHVTINVKDKNDNPPVLKKEVFIYHISEDLGPNNVIATLHPEDADVSNNGMFSFGILPPTEEFSVGIESGVIRVKKKLNKTAQSWYRFNVVVWDSDDPWYNATAVVLVYLTNNTSPASSSSLGRSSLMPYLHWKYTITFSLLVLIIILAIAVFLLLRKLNSTSKELIETKLTETTTEMKSLLTYFKKPGESMEVTMKFSCESIPSSYQEVNHNKCHDPNNEMVQLTSPTRV